MPCKRHAAVSAAVHARACTALPPVCRGREGRWLVVASARWQPPCHIPWLACLQGLASVDSYSFNPHKWLLTNFDCCAMFVADAGPLREALSLTPVFLQAPQGNALDYKDWQIPLGRKFR